MIETEARKEAAYVAGQNAGFANKPAYSVCPFDQASQGDEFFAFLDGHEDGQEMYRRESN